MGIRGFSQAIQPYGVISPLSGDSVVIDGPALVHRISEACMRQRPSSSGFVCHPPYSLLSRMVIIWLDELRSHDVNVRKIYFDGYLPPSKWEVRRKRLLNQSQHMKALVSSEPFGSATTPESAFSDLIADITFTRLIGRTTSNTLPKPPFMVPAVLEALKNSEDWGPLVVVVPGEADMFCAQDIRENGGTLLTSDSDLLIQDLGPEGNVSFFWDVVPVDPTSKQPGMMACKMSFHDINERLGLTNIGGLPRVAFEKQKGGMGFNTALQKARDSRKDTLNSLEYLTFLEELELKEYIPAHHPVLSILSSLDPRISEVVIQTLLLEKGPESSALDAKKLRGPETLSIFLPILVENRDKRSAWTVSTNVRQIAYSVLQELVHQRSGMIIEYRTLDSSTALTGRQVEIPDLEETIANCTQQVATLKKLAKSVPSLDMQWLAFAIYQDVEWSSLEQRSPLSAILVNKSLNQPKNPDEYSWDLIHFTAQVQACLYSLRIEKQILDVVLSMGRDLPVPVQQLRDCLESLPLIAEWPTVERMFNLLSKFGNAQGLTKIANILGIPSVKVEEVAMDSTEPKKRQKKDQQLLSSKRHQRDAKTSPSINPFAVLSQASQD
ncbi:XPG domain containing-domain-containing protein [Hypoxylon sp. FL0890]|nr:XPG domain containing-domain-containing protein [Hypoxylon sp. FL0890]